jgi:hypothetical protein
MHRRVLALFADTHGGHKLGLLNPETQLIEEDEDGNLVPYTPNLTAFQHYLWPLYERHVEEAVEWAGKDEIIVAHVGDECQGDKYTEHQVSTRRADQIDIAVWNMLPWCSVENVETVRLIKGTGSHAMQEGSSTIQVCRVLQGKFPNKDIKAPYHNLLNIDGVGVDLAHHGPYPGSRKWLKGNVARYYLRDFMMEEILAGRKPADLVVRAHYHVPVTETLDVRANGDKYTSHLVVLPSYCGLGDHTRQATRSKHKVTNGMFLYEIIDGELNPKPFELVETQDLRTKEVL